MRLVARLALTVLFLVAPLAAEAAPKRVLVFGDSNSWG
jgi:hypothetical protein